MISSHLPSWCRSAHVLPRPSSAGSSRGFVPHACSLSVADDNLPLRSLIHLKHLHLRFLASLCVLRLALGVLRSLCSRRDAARHCCPICSTIARPKHFDFDHNRLDIAADVLTHSQSWLLPRNNARSPSLAAVLLVRRFPRIASLKQGY